MFFIATALYSQGSEAARKMNDKKMRRQRIEVDEMFWQKGQEQDKSDC